MVLGVSLNIKNSYSTEDNTSKFISSAYLIILFNKDLGPMFLYFSFNEKSNKNIIELSSSGNSLQVLTSIKACASGYPVLLPDTESFLYNSSLQSQANITSQKPRPS